MRGRGREGRGAREVGANGFKALNIIHIDYIRAATGGWRQQRRRKQQRRRTVSDAAVVVGRRAGVAAEEDARLRARAADVLVGVEEVGLRPVAGRHRAALFVASAAGGRGRRARAGRRAGPARREVRERRVRAPRARRSVSDFMIPPARAGGQHRRPPASWPPSSAVGGRVFLGAILSLSWVPFSLALSVNPRPLRLSHE